MRDNAYRTNQNTFFSTSFPSHAGTKTTKVIRLEGHNRLTDCVRVYGTAESDSSRFLRNASGTERIRRPSSNKLFFKRYMKVLSLETASQRVYPPPPPSTRRSSSASFMNQLAQSKVKYKPRPRRIPHKIEQQRGRSNTLYGGSRNYVFGHRNRFEHSIFTSFSFSLCKDIDSRLCTENRRAVSRHTHCRWSLVVRSSELAIIIKIYVQTPIRAYTRGKKKNAQVLKVSKGFLPIFGDLCN